MPDLLTIHDLAVDCRIGVTDAERATPQPIRIDLELQIDAAKAAATDQVTDALNYAALVSEVKALAESRPFSLLETLSEAIASLILSRFGTPSVRVRVKKRALPGVDFAAVEMTRRRAVRRDGRAGGRRRTRSRFPRGART